MLLLTILFYDFLQVLCILGLANLAVPIRRKKIVKEEISSGTIFSIVFALLSIGGLYICGIHYEANGLTMLSCFTASFKYAAIASPILVISDYAMNHGSEEILLKKIEEKNERIAENNKKEKARKEEELRQFVLNGLASAYHDLSIAESELTTAAGSDFDEETVRSVQYLKEEILKIRKAPEENIISSASVKKLVSYYIPAILSLLSFYAEISSTEIMETDKINRTKNEIQKSMEDLCAGAESIYAEIYNDDVMSNYAEAASLRRKIRMDGFI